MSALDNTRLTATVHGRVQRVGFRFFVRENARQLGLTGWVRNRDDRSVEVIAEGERSSLEQLLASLERGPSGSQVSEVEHQWGSANGEFKNFSIKLFL